MSHIRRSRPWALPERLATPERIHADRRQVLRTLGLGTLSLALPSIASAAEPADDVAAMTAPAIGSRFADLFPAPRSDAWSLGDRSLTPEQRAASYNNFYEFTLDKAKVWKLAQAYELKPWTVEVRGLVKKPKTFDLDALMKLAPLEERLYRFRCVERWAMQVPWTGYALSKLIDACEPLGAAKYVTFQTIHDPSMPGVASQPWYPWPYVEALRLDEARHPLAFVAVGIYGHAMPMQHGAPWRVVTPWKYGYKSPKSIVALEFTAEQPSTFWNDAQPDEYGFYSNVEPHKPHPRWSQRFETDIGTQEQRETLLYNGYADEVGSLYTGREV
ncbi:MAG: protein-methionine-sulfoxide reductase catalytic subunit MsrP [Acidobacteriota bacterium]